MPENEVKTSSESILSSIKTRIIEKKIHYDDSIKKQEVITKIDTKKEVPIINKQKETTKIDAKKEVPVGKVFRGTKDTRADMYKMSIFMPQVYLTHVDQDPHFDNDKYKSKLETKEQEETKEKEETKEPEESEYLGNNFIYGLGQTIKSAYNKYFGSSGDTTTDDLKQSLLRNSISSNKLEIADINYWNEKARKDKIEQLSDSIRNNIISLKIPTFRNSIGFASGIATPDNRFFTTDRGQWTSQKGYNIAAPWNNWVDTDKAYSNPSLIRNSYFNRYLPEGQYPTYITVDDKGRMSISDTIPNIKGKITTGYYTKGKRIVPGAWQHETDNNAWQMMTGDSIPSSPNSSISSYTYNKNNLDNLNYPVVNMIVGTLPNGEQTWIMPYGRTHKQFVEDVNNFSSAFGEEKPDLKFVSFDAGRNRYSIMDNSPRIYTGFGTFPNLLLKYRCGGRKSLKNI